MFLWKTYCKSLVNQIFGNGLFHDELCNPAATNLLDRSNSLCWNTLFKQLLVVHSENFDFDENTFLIMRYEQFISQQVPELRMNYEIPLQQDYGINGKEYTTNLISCFIESFKHLRYTDQMESDDIDICPICLDSRKSGDIIAILPCEHRYHLKCIEKWFKSSYNAVFVRKT